MVLYHLMVCNCANETLYSRLQTPAAQHRHFVVMWHFPWKMPPGGSASWWLSPSDSFCGLLTFATCRTAPRNFLLYSHEFCNAGRCFAVNILHISGHFFSSIRVITPYLVGELVGVLQGLQFVYFNVFEYKGQSSDLTCLLARHNSCFDWILLVTDVLWLD